MIRSVLTGGDCRVELVGSRDLLTISESFLTPSIPQKGEDVIILEGEHRGVPALLWSVESTEAVVKIRGTDMIMIDLGLLARYEKR